MLFAPDPDRRRVAAWLLVCAAWVMLVLVVGGLTRLTHSGLSIVQWAPVSGILPPLADADWARAFDAYRASPEFLALNPSMDLDGFRSIFWWEWTHRLLARGTGLVFLLPFFYFLLTRTVRGALAWRLAGIFALGGLQGLMGWLMVKSGLADDPHVSPLRLAAHLGLALLILASMVWTALGLLHGRSRSPTALAPWGGLLALGVWGMALLGALVAGNHAGLVYNTFPWMGDGLVPPDLWLLTPWTDNLLHNPATLQFAHRACALLLVVMALGIALVAALREPRLARASLAVALAVLLQAGLGVATLLSGVWVPLAAAHQAGAVLLFVAVLRFAHALAVGPAPEPFSTRRY
jgi:cytochrome c oxidase assembly protein subunit 15